jgi:outer membrane protein, heavy metal efflux system
MRAWTTPLIVLLTLVGTSATAVEPQSVAPPHYERGPVVRVGRQDVLQRASARGPGILVARSGKASAARTREAASSFLSLPPRLEVEVARHSYPGGAGMDVTAALWQDLSLGGMGAARRDFAKASTNLRAVEFQLARREAVHNAMLAWIDAWHWRALVALRAKSVSLAEQMFRIAQSRLEAGSVPPVELSLAASVLGAARASLLDAHGRVVEADARLRHGLGLPPDRPVEIVGDLERSDDGPIDEKSHIEQVRRAHPLVKLAEAHATQADAHAELQASRGRPVLGVGVSYARETTGDRILGAMVSLPLPLVNPAAIEASTARGDADMARMRVQEIADTLAREIRVAIHEREHTRELRAALRTGALGPGRDALREVLKRYEGGAVGLAETLSARREFVAVEEAYLAACADVHRADANLAYIAAGPVFGKVNP